MAGIPKRRPPPPREPPRAPQRLYVVTSRAADARELAGALDASLDAVDVAAVLLRLPEDAAGDTLADDVKRIAPLVQGKDIALILDGYPDLAVQTGADGAHLSGIERFTAAVGVLKPQCIAGAGGLRTRHDAMLAGEAGADYVMFGDPHGGRPALEAIVERIAWWAELFEVPCVGYAAGLEEVPALAAAGADFIALGEFVFVDSRGPSAMIRAAAELLPRPESGQ